MYKNRDQTDKNKWLTIVDMQKRLNYKKVWLFFARLKIAETQAENSEMNIQRLNIRYVTIIYIYFMQWDKR